MAKNYCLSRIFLIRLHLILIIFVLSIDPPTLYNFTCEYQMRVLIIKNGACPTEIINIIKNAFKRIKQLTPQLHNAKLDIFLVESSKMTDNVYEELIYYEDPSWYDGIIILGGPQRLNNGKITKYPYLQKVVNLIKHFSNESVPILGICLGAQLLALSHGYDIIKNPDGIIDTYDRILEFYENKMQNERLCTVIKTNHKYYLSMHHDHVYFGDGEKENICIMCRAIHNDYLIPYCFSIGNNIGIQFHPDILYETLCSICAKISKGNNAEYDVPNELLEYAAKHKNKIELSNIEFFFVWILEFLLEKVEK